MSEPRTKSSNFGKVNVFSVLALVLFAGCGKGTNASYVLADPYEVWIVVPDGFKGVVEFKTTPGVADPFKRNGSHLEVDVPRSGLVPVPNLDIFQGSIHDVVRTKAGHVFDVENHSASKGQTEAFSLGYSVSQGKPPRVGYYIGTHDEFAHVDRIKVGY
ncbi:MAG TPA: hypothetical protein VG944_12775 [Fimbriimonas sp.]|nr:hypothetical protein [Fimbriimonas sp.]